MGNKLIAPVGATIAGAGLYGAHSYNQTRNLKALPGETPEEFEKRRRKLILASVASGALAGGVLGHGLSYNKGQMLGSGLGLASAEMMSSDDVNFDNMSAKSQDEQMRLKSYSRVLGSVGGGVVGRLAGTDKVPGLNKRASLSLRERLVRITK
jgi:hypothetical protein